MSKNRHIGSSFDAFLAEEGIRVEVPQVATKRVTAWQNDSVTMRTLGRVAEALTRAHA